MLTSKKPTSSLHGKHFYTLMKFLQLLIKSFNLLLLLFKPLKVLTTTSISLSCYESLQLYMIIMSR